MSLRRHFVRAFSTSIRRTTALPTHRKLDTAPAEAYGPSTRSFPLRLKADHVPAVQRWSALLPHAEVVVGTFGVQSTSADDLRDSPFMAWADNALTHANGPSTVDHARYTDAAGYTTHVVSGYWPTPAAYERWAADPALEAWWAAPARLEDETGVWREIIRVPRERMESIYWLDYPGGMMKDPSVKIYPTPYCGYYGAMRDRLPVAANDPLSPSSTTRRVERETNGARWRVVPPLNLAIIRSAHTWQYMDAEQDADYRRKLAPPLERGMSYLASEPESSGCLSMRVHQTVDREGREVPEQHSTGHFLSLGHMEEWSERHRTHAAIFAAATARYKHYGSRNQLRTWHEVYVLPEGGQVFEYINCHPDTGIVSYFEAEKL